MSEKDDEKKPENTGQMLLGLASLGAAIYILYLVFFS
jgi:hypothetical protein